MLKTIALGMLTLALSFFVGVTYVNAQSATASPTPTMADEADDTPSAAPQTGFGN